MANKHDYHIYLPYKQFQAEKKLYNFMQMYFIITSTLRVNVFDSTDITIHCTSGRITQLT